MRVFGLVLASLLTTAGASGSAHAQTYYGGNDGKYQHELRKEQRECAKELREAKNRREYNKAQRECRQEIAKVHREYRYEFRTAGRDWSDDRRWSRQGDDDDRHDD